MAEPHKNPNSSLTSKSGDPPLIIVMGVSGSGKTTVGKLLAEKLGVDFYDADHYHPRENVAKMEKGEPLTDEDRWPWLQTLNTQMREWSENGAILGCSALKAEYRTVLQAGLPHLRWVHLSGSRELILARMQARTDHFMPASLLDSQIATLEAPDDALVVDIDKQPVDIVDEILTRLH